MNMYIYICIHICTIGCINHIIIEYPQAPVSLWFICRIPPCLQGLNPTSYPMLPRGWLPNLSCGPLLSRAGCYPSVHSMQHRQLPGAPSLKRSARSTRARCARLLVQTFGLLHCYTPLESFTHQLTELIAIHHRQLTRIGMRVVLMCHSLHPHMRYVVGKRPSAMALMDDWQSEESL